MARPRMQRPPEKTDGIAAANVNHAALNAAGDSAAAHAREIALTEKQFGIGVPYNRDLFVQRAKQLMGALGRDSLELGLIFIQIKQREGHGNFLETLAELGVDTRSAQRFMQAARKFGGSEHRKQLANQLGIGKVLALIAEEDSAIDELANGGELNGHTADEFSRMTKADLIKALRIERDEHADEKAADEEIIRKKDERINKLSRRSTRTTMREQATELLADIDAHAVEIATHMKQVRDTVTALRALYDDAGERMDEEVAQRIEQSSEYLQKWVHDVEEIFE